MGKVLSKSLFFVFCIVLTILCTYSSMGLVFATNNPTTLDERLISAASHGDQEAVRNLLAAGANPNASRDETRPIHAAIREDVAYGGIVRALVEAGADINVADELGMTPLDAAEFYKHRTVADYLKANGARRSLLESLMWPIKKVLYSYM